MSNVWRKRIGSLMMAAGVVTGATAVVPGWISPVAAATSCTASAVTDPLKVEMSPTSDLHAWDTVTVSFSGTLTDGHCAGDSFSFDLPENLMTNDGGSYPLTAADKSEVAVMTTENNKVTVTLTDYVESHTGVSLSGWLSSQVRNKLDPNSSGTMTWVVNGETSKIEVSTGECAHCSGTDKMTKWGSYSKETQTQDVSIRLPITTADETDYEVTDQLTSDGQKFDCPVQASTTTYTTLDAWNDPTDEIDGPTPEPVSCSDKQTVQTVHVSGNGTIAEMHLQVKVTDPSAKSWTDTATVTGGTNGTADGTVYNTYAGGGEGGGTTASPTTTTSPATDTTSPDTTTSPATDTTSPDTTTSPATTTSPTTDTTSPATSTTATTPTSTTGAPSDDATGPAYDKGQPGATSTRAPVLTFPTSVAAAATSSDPSASTAGTSDAPSTLARTGSDAPAMVGLAGGLIVVGAGMAGASRLRRPRHVGRHL